MKEEMSFVKFSRVVEIETLKSVPGIGYHRHWSALHSDDRSRGAKLNHYVFMQSESAANSAM